MIAVFTLGQDFRHAGAEIHALRSLISTGLVGRSKCGFSVSASSSDGARWSRNPRPFRAGATIREK
jgi:hypothetical protein